VNVACGSGTGLGTATICVETIGAPPDAGVNVSVVHGLANDVPRILNVGRTVYGVDQKLADGERWTRIRWSMRRPAAARCKEQEHYRDDPLHDRDAITCEMRAGSSFKQRGITLARPFDIGAQASRIPS
jgi:hypothetical protein